MEDMEVKKATVNLGGNSAVTVEGDTAKFVNKVAVTAAAILAVVYVIKAFKS